jgi:glutathione S-transferase
LVPRGRGPPFEAWRTMSRHLAPHNANCLVHRLVSQLSESDAGRAREVPRKSASTSASQFRSFDAVMKRQRERALERHANRQFIATEDFTVADILMTHVLVLARAVAG